MNSVKFADEIVVDIEQARRDDCISGSTAERLSKSIRSLAQMTDRVKIEKIGMGTKPDPYKFKIVRLEVVGENTVIMANYDGCTTYDGNKLMVLKGIHKEFETLDPHFIEDHPVLARFPPTDEGWELARLVCRYRSLYNVHPIWDYFDNQRN